MSVPSYSTSTGNSVNVIPIPVSLSQTMLKAPTPSLIAGACAREMTINRGEGTSKMFVGVDNLPLLQATTATATQGPAPIQPTYFATTITAQVYAEAVIIPVTVRISSQIPWISVIINRLRVASLRTEDIILAKSLISSANMYRCQYGSNGQSPSEMALNDSISLYSLFCNFNAPQTVEGSASSDFYNSFGFSGGFVLLTSTLGMGSFAVQGQQSFTTFSNVSRPEDVLPGSFGRFAGAGGIYVMASSQWEGARTALSAGNFPVITASLVSADSYMKVIHPEMYHRINVVGSAYLGINNLQEGVSANLWVGAGITQSTWITSVLYTSTTN